MKILITDSVVNESVVPSRSLAGVHRRRKSWPTLCRGKNARWLGQARLGKDQASFGYAKLGQVVSMGQTARLGLRGLGNTVYL